MKKIIIILISLIVILAIGYLILGKMRYSIPENSILKVYSSESECKAETRMDCSFRMCDYAPEGKTLEEVCGKNFREGWVGIRTK